LIPENLSNRGAILGVYGREDVSGGAASGCVANRGSPNLTAYSLEGVDRPERFRARRTERECRYLPLVEIAHVAQLAIQDMIR